MRNLPRSATFALAIAANAAVLASSAPDAAMAASFKTIYAFTIDTGSGAVSPLLLGPNQTFYGMRYGGQAAGYCSTIFAFANDAATLVTNLPGNGAGCESAYALVSDASGDLYGAATRSTFSEDSPGNGNVFEFTSNGAYASLHAFNGMDGAGPEGPLTMDKAGNLYGTTSTGGSTNQGTVFEITADGVFKVLHSFNGTDGSVPQGKLVYSKGKLFGTTDAGGPQMDGTVFSLSLDGTLTTLHNFSGPDGLRPATGLMMDKFGELYGSTAQDTNMNDGTLFKISQSGAFMTLHTFDGNDGYLPVGQLVQDRSGTLYGVTYYGGAGQEGTVFSLATDGTKFTTIHGFTSQKDDGGNPTGLTVKSASEIYGVTTSGGTENRGTIFEVKH